MKIRKLFCVECLLVTLILYIAAAFRLPQLSLRPMHTDEAVHAVKFGELLETQTYRYDPHEYHGPTLNYATLIPAWIRGEHRLADLDEWTLRLVPVFFGLLLIPLLLWLRDGLGGPAILAAMFWTAISPSMIFFSRYYIQEMLLVCFTLGLIGAGHRYFVTRKVRWVVVLGLFAGLMHATKETSILIGWTIGMAALFALFWHTCRRESDAEPLPRPRWVHFVIAALVGIGVSALFFSSFGSNPHGIVDSVAAYKSYFGRAGAGQHLQPWYAYLRWFLAFRAPGQLLWTEGIIAVFGIAGMVAAFRRKCPGGVNGHVLHFLGVYTVALTLMDCLIPYKTPWSFLPAWLGWILLAGAGVASGIEFIHHKIGRFAFILFLVAGSLHLAGQAWILNFRLMDSPSNPYVYAHPGEDVKKIAERIRAVALAQPEDLATHIEVIARGSDYWPLPWYFRSLSGTGWWDHVPMDSPAAPILLVTPQLEKDLIYKLYEVPPPGERLLYVPLFETAMELRPEIEIRVYVRKDAWDRYASR